MPQMFPSFAFNLIERVEKNINVVSSKVIKKNRALFYRF